MHQLPRPTFSLYGGLAIALIQWALSLFGVTVNLWMGCALWIAVTGLFVDFVWRSEWTVNKSKLTKGSVTGGVIILMTLLAWKPVSDQYEREHVKPVVKLEAAPQLQPIPERQRKPEKTEQKARRQWKPSTPQPTTLPHQVKPPEQKQPTPNQITLRTLFKTDFPHYMKYTREMLFTDPKGKQLTIGGQLYLDFQSKSKFVGFFLPNPGYSPDEVDITFNICMFLSDNYKQVLDISKSAKITGKMIGEESTEASDLTFSGRVFVYHEQELSVEKISELRKLYRGKNLDVQFKGPDYLAFKLITEKPDPPPPPTPTKQ